MGRVIILEGPDGGGKTTLAKELVKHGFEYRHEGTPPEGVDLIAYYLKILNDSIESPRDVVHDRLWLGEMVYGPIFRGVDRLGIRGLKLFQRMHTSKDIGMFICCPFYETLIENYKIKMSDPSDYVKGIDNLDKVYNLYLKIHFEIKPISWIFNYCNNNESQLLDYNNKKILPKGTIGSPSAKYLFIGDKPNHNSIDVPFFAITGSSGYLNEALELAGIREKDLALSNAYGPNGMIHNPDEIIASLPNLEYIILMGNKAHDWFYKEVSYIKGKCRCIPHRSYLNRFHGHNPQVMADIIKGALNG